MSLLFESIKILNGRAYNIIHHNNRLNESRKRLFNRSDFIDLNALINIPERIRKGLFKCRIIYSEKILRIEFEPYIYRDVKSLKLVYDDSIDYRYKYQDRNALNKLLQLKDDCDDILIIKNGFVTDTSYSNIAFFDGGKWVTPSTPLLCGTKREFLLKEGFIHEEEIKTRDIRFFNKAVLLNAFYDFENRCEIEIKEIIT
ncbi:MAG: aminotransferase class IV [Desulfobulbaceae bacterium]|nr:aminotransferase class IV [Desulfobulbaceae bacterium]